MWLHFVRLWRRVETARRVTAGVLLFVELSQCGRNHILSDLPDNLPGFLGSLTGIAVTLVFLYWLAFWKPRDPN
jgi:hypothetical protein